MKEKKPKLTTQERIAKYLANIPPAIAGSGGHNQTFSVACSLCNGWNLSGEDTLAWLKVYNERCEPKWSDKELVHKAASAAEAEHQKPRGHFLDSSIDDQRGEPDWTIPNKPLATGKVSPTQLTTLTTLKSNLYRKSVPIKTQKDSKPVHLSAYPRDLGNNVVTVVNSGFSALVSSENTKNSEKGVSSVSAEQLPPEQLAEAARIAKELVKLRDAGAISADPGDPEARFYAQFLHGFGAEFTGKRNPKKPQTDL